MSLPLNITIPTGNKKIGLGKINVFYGKLEYVKWYVERVHFLYLYDPSLSPSFPQNLMIWGEIQHLSFLYFSLSLIHMNIRYIEMKSYIQKKIGLL